jgi:hypothetical protein
VVSAGRREDPRREVPENEVDHARAERTDERKNAAAAKQSNKKCGVCLMADGRSVVSLPAKAVPLLFRGFLEGSFVQESAVVLSTFTFQHVVVDPEHTDACTSCTQRALFNLYCEISLNPLGLVATLWYLMYYPDIATIDQSSTRGSELQNIISVLEELCKRGVLPSEDVIALLEVSTTDRHRNEARSLERVFRQAPLSSLTDVAWVSNAMKPPTSTTIARTSKSGLLVYGISSYSGGKVTGSAPVSVSVATTTSPVNGLPPIFNSDLYKPLNATMEKIGLYGPHEFNIEVERNMFEASIQLLIASANAIDGLLSDRFKDTESMTSGDERTEVCCVRCAEHATYLLCTVPRCVVRCGAVWCGALQAKSVFVCYSA